MDEGYDLLGDDINQWPGIGCTMGFTPLANGERFVIELQANGEWEAFLADRMGSIIDDDIKKVG